MLATTIHKSNTTPHHQSGATTRRHSQRSATPRRGHGPVVSKPNSVFSSSITNAFPRRLNVCHLHPPDTHYRSWLKYPNRTTAHDYADGGGIESVLLRKEVIQPHLPVRLPCYDFVPIADPTFDGSLHKG